MDLENLNIPPVENLRHADLIRQPILHAGRSATLGFWLVLIPAFFLACVVMKYYFHWNMGLLDAFESLIARVDEHPVFFWFQPLLLLAAPLAAFMLNLLAVLHVRVDHDRKELNINVKLKWWNLLLAAAGLAIVGIFTLYLIADNVREG